MSNITQLNGIHGEEISLLDLFIDKKMKIKVPAIQRDYAQGRKTKRAEKIRTDFIDQLIEYIKDGDTHSLDFVYGYEEDGCFVPLDGQQRLTTLWLLHLYLAGLTKRSVNNFFLTYETRDSSNRFCQALLSHNSVFSPEALKTKICESNDKKKSRRIHPSEIIKNEEWWFGSWMSDPTVNGMLVMLDHIDSTCYCESALLADRLFNTERQPIVFEFLHLLGIHDTDDLYIKMNARGLPLTSFEIFKSKLIEDIEKNINDKECEQFKIDIDVNWSDTLWSRRTSSDKNVDRFFENALKLLISSEAVISSSNKDVLSKNYDKLFEAKNNTITFSHNWYEKLGVVFSKKLLLRITEDLNVLFSGDMSVLCNNLSDDYDNHWFDVKSIIEGWILRYQDGKSDSKITYDTRLRIHAYLHFVQQNGIDGTLLTEWMRLIHNLTEATRINEAEDFVKALLSIEEMLRKFKECGCRTINEWVSSTQFAPSFFLGSQWEEEKVKAELRKNANWASLIDKAEKHSYLDGQIGMTFYVSDVYSSIAPLKVNSSITPVAYEKCLDRILPLFDAIGNSESESIKDFKMVKAMLALGDYIPNVSDGRYNIYNNPGHRDYSWKRLFRLDGAQNLLEALNSLKKIIDDQAYDPSDVNKSLDEITKNNLSAKIWWKNALIGEHGTRILSRSKQGFVKFENNNVLIYHQSQRNHYHSELQSLLLYEKLKHEMKLKVSYRDVKSREADSGVKYGSYFICQWNGQWTLWNEDKEQSESLDIQDVDKVIEELEKRKVIIE